MTRVVEEPLIRVPENRLARYALKQLVHRAARQTHMLKQPPLLYLHGEPGTGKSCLVSLAQNRMTRLRPDFTARIVAARDLGTNARGQFRTEDNPEIICRDSDFLVLEDVQYLPASASDRLAMLLDHRQVRGRITIVTAATGPAQRIQLGHRLSSRLAAGLVVRLRRLSLASRLYCLKKWSASTNIALTKEDRRQLAQQYSGGFRELHGAFLRQASLQQWHSSSSNHDGDAHGQSIEPAKCPLEKIANRVARFFNLTTEQLRSRTRQRHLLWPRHVSMYLARQQTDLSLASIGKFFGGYDHSTVLHALDKVRQNLHHDSTIQELLEIS